jgi:1-aminocyclopropane-1-carboxylate deaminase/D-cysteine desulfhydrase-like pyridoxal-dependent ACC family enzyme
VTIAEQGKNATITTVRRRVKLLELDQVYEFLEALGYEMSDEERELKEGTHHLFVHTGRS